MTSDLYTADFYQHRLAGSYFSAQRIVPRVLDLIQVRSVVDIGCGLGHFLKAFAECGVADLVGIDGEWVPQEQLVIPLDRFAVQDLSKPFALGRHFDLVVSLEVAEHLASEVADQFIDGLVAHAPVVLFSAAIPNQGGHGHVNEQWLSYWVDKFGRRGFRPLDLLRPAFWSDQAIAWWYRQNALLFASDVGLAANPALAKVAPAAPPPLDLVHPDFYINMSRQAHSLVKHLASGGLFLVDRKPDGSLNVEKV